MDGDGALRCLSSFLLSLRAVNRVLRQLRTANRYFGPNVEQKFNISATCA
jgi:hypothetical protein